MRFRLRAFLVVFLLLCLSAPWWARTIVSSFSPRRDLPDIHINADWEKMASDEIDQLWADVEQWQDEAAREQAELQKAVDEYNRNQHR